MKKSVELDSDLLKKLEIISKEENLKMEDIIEVLIINFVHERD